MYGLNAGIQAETRAAPPGAVSTSSVPRGLAFGGNPSWVGGRTRSPGPAASTSFLYPRVS